MLARMFISYLIKLMEGRPNSQAFRDMDVRNEGLLASPDYVKELTEAANAYNAANPNSEGETYIVETRTEDNNFGEAPPEGRVRYRILGLWQDTGPLHDKIRELRESRTKAETKLD